MIPDSAMIWQNGIQFGYLPPMLMLIDFLIHVTQLNMEVTKGNIDFQGIWVRANIGGVFVHSE